MAGCRAMQVLALAAVVAWSGDTRATEPPKASVPKLNELSLEVSALQTLYALQLTPEQGRQLRRLARNTADTTVGRQPARASEKYRKTLVELHAALVKRKDDALIQKLNDQLDKLLESEKPAFDDGVEITDEARDAVPKVMRLLTPAQAAAYLGGVADTIADPRQRLKESVRKARGMKDKEWKTLRDEVSQEVSSLVAGLDADRASRITEQVAQLLILARGLTEAELKKEQPALQKKIQAILGDIGPVEVLRHVLEEHLAELLSNPQLEAALAAQQK